MLLSIRDFKSRVREDMNGLVADLQDATGRLGAEEADAWRASLPAVAQLLSVRALDPCHVFFAERGSTSLEYQLPAAPSWCDLILLGSARGRPSALIMELKHWHVANDVPGPVEGLMVRGGVRKLHPSRQVGNYTEYVRRFHSEVLARDALVSGCVFFSRSGIADAYSAKPNHLLATTYPIFTTSTADVEKRFPEFAMRLLTEPSEEFAQAFEQGAYRQDRGFVKQIGEQILKPANSPFVLLDKQDQAYLECRERVRRVVDERDGTPRKHVVIVHGPPGSGKSVVAARLWASLVTDGTLRAGNVVITTTSLSQNSNWVHLVQQAAGMAGAGGIVKKATSYVPALQHEIAGVQRRFGKDVVKEPNSWRENVELVRKLRPFRPGSEDNAYLVSLVDEAHALINPEHPDGRAGPLGFAVCMGPLAYHIIRASQLSIFFMDADQGFRDRENTAVDDIRKWAGELGASLDEIDLEGLQFRCAGSKEFADWIQVIRSNAHPSFAARHAERWRHASAEAPSQRMAAVGEPRVQSYGPRGSMVFDIVDSPAVLESSLGQHRQAGYTVRLLASFSRKWKTKDVEAPHRLPPELQDFQIPYVAADGSSRVWSRPWNVAPNGDYTGYVQAAPGSAMASDPLCEVGCPYAVRGFDFDYVGLIWSNDLVWRTDRWEAGLDHVKETGMKASVQRARREKDPSGPAHAELLKRVWQSYRILLTRALRGVILFVEDPETRAYLATASMSAK